MMWDFSGSSSNEQHSHPQHPQSFDPASSPGGFAVPQPAYALPLLGAPDSYYNAPPAPEPWVPSIPRGSMAAPPAIHRPHSSHGHHRTQPQIRPAPRPLSVHQHHSSQPPKSPKRRPPPSPVQVHFTSSGESNSHGYHQSFQYSRCTGQKKAVCIGVNYYTTPSKRLNGCINDVQNVKRFLRSRGYEEKNIVVLTDDGAPGTHSPTRKNMIKAMKWLVQDAHPHDSLFFHYSGHGGQVKDTDGDEIDGYDEVIYPVDFAQKGHITDDLLHEIMVKDLPVGCRLTALFDSCHSGSVLDLPYLYSSRGHLKRSQVTKKWLRYKSTHADVISWCGCKDSQTSADTWQAGAATGAMSHAFIQSLQRSPNATYKQLLQSIREILRHDYKQKPQLSSSHEIDTNLKWII